MLPEVDNVILETIRDSLGSVPKSNVLIHRSIVPPKKTPTIYVWNRAFKALDLSVGGDLGETGQLVMERFDGDGKKLKFKLSNPPLRPLLSAESPPERRLREGEDFKVNYQSGVLTLENPPEKGRENLFVRYRSGKGAGELKGLRVKLAYDVDVWASEAQEQSSLVNRIVSSLLKRKDDLGEKGIRLTILGGRDLTSRDGVPDGSFCKRVQCVAETNISVKLAIPRIETVELMNPRMSELRNRP